MSFKIRDGFLVIRDNIIAASEFRDPRIVGFFFRENAICPLLIYVPGIARRHSFTGETNLESS